MGQFGHFGVANLLTVPLAAATMNEGPGSGFILRGILLFGLLIIYIME
jgi:hypothetical protein